MKKIYFAIVAVIAALFSFVAEAQTYTDAEKAAVSVDKTVTPTGESNYLLNLETFVKGEATYSESQSLDMDIVLVLDVSGSMDGTKLTNLKTACKSFVSYVGKQAQKTKAVHQVSIVKFAYDESDAVGNSKTLIGWNYSQIVEKLTADTTLLKTDIDALSAGGPTRSDYGLNRAKVALNDARTDAVKVVIMFTDGAPTALTSFQNSVAISALSKSKTLKDSGVLVYTVGLFNDSDKTDKVIKYMEGVSSNFPKASASDSWGTISYKNLSESDRVSNKYYFEATDESKLEGIFESIGEDIVTSNAGINLPVSQVTLKDIITPEFLLPDGESSITVKVANIDNITYSGTLADPGDLTYTWKDPYTVYENGANVATDDAFKDVSVELVESTDGKKSVNVKGFDFSANWVGFDVKKVGKKITSRTTHTNGKKLIIDIDIQYDPNADSLGKISTNAPGSGIYVGDDATEPIVKYEVEPSKVYSPLPLIIVKKGGLKINESILYGIKRGLESTDGDSSTWKEDGDFKNFIVALTKTSNDSDEVRAKIASLPTMDADGNPYYYQVIEIDDVWSWAYKSERVTKYQKLYDNTTDYNTVEFEFDSAVAVDAASTVKHAESYKNYEYNE